jgi:hypothetical protein
MFRPKLMEVANGEVAYYIAFFSTAQSKQFPEMDRTSFTAAFTDIRLVYPRQSQVAHHV